MIHYCRDVTWLPEGLQTLASLQSSSISACHNLRGVQEILCFRSLRKVYIGDCEELTSIPNVSQVCALIEELAIPGFPNLLAILHISSLRTLRTGRCKKVDKSAGTLQF